VPVRDIAVIILNHNANCRGMASQHRAFTILLPGKRPPPPKYPLNRRPYGPWSRSECSVEEENLLLLQGIETQFFRCPAHSLIIVLTILPQLLDRPKQKWNFPLQNQDL